MVPTMQRLLVAIALVSLTLAGAGAAVCAAESYAIFGRVTLPDGAPLPGVTVELGGGLHAQVTDADGRYRADGAVPGTSYTIVPRSDGYSFLPESRSLVMASGDEQVNFGAMPAASDADARSMSVCPGGTTTPDSTKATPAVLYPSATGIVWDLGSTHTITWKGFSSDEVGIALLRAPDEDLVRWLNESTPNDGEFNWTIPGDTAPDDDYLIGIISYTASGVDVSNHPFRIRAVPLVTYPSAAGLSFPRGTDITITWVGFPGTHVNVDLYRGGAFLNRIGPSEDNDGEFPTTIPPHMAPGDDYTIRISRAGDASVRDTSDHPFSITTNPQVTTPSDPGIVWRRGENGLIEWDEFSGGNVRIRLYRGGVLDQVINSSTPNDGHFLWHVPADQPYSDSYEVRITALDGSGDGDWSDNPFSVSRPPKVLYPSDPGLVFGRGTNVTIRWRGFSGTAVRIDAYRGGAYDGDIIASTPNDGSHTASVGPDTALADDYRIRVTSLADPTEWDESNNDFAIARNPRVENPTDAGIVQKIGDVIRITWADFTSANVRIHLYRGGALNRKIATSTPNDGLFRWTIPPDQDVGDDFRVRVANADDPGQDDFSDNPFEIESYPAVTYPNAPGITWVQGSTYTITWQDFPSSPVRLTLYDGDSVYTGIVAATDNDGSYQWRVPNTVPPGDNYRVSITTETGWIVRDQSDFPFTIAPGPKVTSPNEALVYYMGENLEITWARFPGANVRIRLYKGGVWLRSITDSTPNDGRFLWRVPDDLEVGTDYRIKIKSNLSPDQWDESDRDFTIAHRPRVIYPSAPGIDHTLGENLDIRWENFLGDQVWISLRRGGTHYHNISPGTPNDGRFLWRIPDDITGGDDYRVHVSSSGFPMEDDSNNDFTITVLPEVLYPSDSGIVTHRLWTLPIQWRRFEGTNVDIMLYKGGAWDSTIAWNTLNDGSYTWPIPPAMATGTDYRIRIRNSADLSHFDVSDNDFEIAP